jgi:serine/threonine-protein kinase
MSLETAPTEPASRRCSRCGCLFNAGSLAGLCPRCLFEGALDAEPEETDEGSGRSSFFGGYELVAKLGEGGMGVVYEARQIGGIRRVVALKRIREGELAGEAERRRFFDEAEAAAKLDHPHIVPIYDVGEENGQPYFTMKLMPGGTLAEAAPRFADPRRAAALLSSIARAVHAGHERGILHRDLKPENILFDERGRPYVADFGVAKHLEREDNTSTVAAPGTVHYIAPEQTSGSARRNTVAVDVWSLGVILYELLAGRRPFDGPTAWEVLRNAAEEEPEALERLRPEVSRDLATVCMTCLQKDPGRRYISAEALADDLDRVLCDAPPEARRPGRFERMRRWSGRYPAAAATFLSSAVLLVTLTLWALAGMRAQERARRKEVLDTNVYAARAVAGAVLVQLDAYAAEVAKEARDPRLAEALERGDEEALQALCEAMYRRHGGDTSRLPWWFVVDTEGRPRAHAPVALFGKHLYYNYTFRDYFRGAMALAGGEGRPVYISRAIRATTDNQYKLVFSSPILGGDGRVLGLLATDIATGRELGALKLSDEHRIAVLTVRLDRDMDMAGDDLPNEHILLVHNGVEHGEGVVVESAALRRLMARRDAEGGGEKVQFRLPPPEWVEAEEDYQDPLAERSPHDTAGGPWLAGMAAVGHTDLTVIVQTRLEDATALDRMPLRVLAAWSVGGAALLCAALFAALRSSRRRIRIPPAS